MYPFTNKEIKNVKHIVKVTNMTFLKSLIRDFLKKKAIKNNTTSDNAPNKTYISPSLLPRIYKPTNGLPNTITRDKLKK